MTGDETAIPGRRTEDAGGRGAFHLPGIEATPPRGLKPPGSIQNGGRGFSLDVPATGDGNASDRTRGRCLGVPESQSSRVAVFTIVGVIGYGVQTAVLWLLVGRLGWAVVPATLVATEAAVLHNFLWHLRWTWADRPAGARAAGWRLLRFNLSNGGFSLVGGAAIMALLVDALGVHYLLANLAAVLVVSIANFLASDRFVFTRAAKSDAPASRHTTYKTTAM